MAKKNAVTTKSTEERAKAVLDSIAESQGGKVSELEMLFTLMCAMGASGEKNTPVKQSRRQRKKNNP